MARLKLLTLLLFSALIIQLSAAAPITKEKTESVALYQTSSLTPALQQVFGCCANPDRSGLAGYCKDSDTQAMLLSDCCPAAAASYTQDNQYTPFNYNDCAANYWKSIANGGCDSFEDSPEDLCDVGCCVNTDLDGVQACSGKTKNTCLSTNTPQRTFKYWNLGFGTTERKTSDNPCVNTDDQAVPGDQFARCAQNQIDCSSFNNNPSDCRSSPCFWCSSGDAGTCTDSCSTCSQGRTSTSNEHNCVVPTTDITTRGGETPTSCTNLPENSCTTTTGCAWCGSANDNEGGCIASTACNTCQGTSAPVGGRCVAQCSDRIDNDDDGRIDTSDPCCSSTTQNYNPNNEACEPQCPFNARISAFSRECRCAGIVYNKPGQAAENFYCCQIDSTQTRANQCGSMGIVYLNIKNQNDVPIASYTVTIKQEEKIITTTSSSPTSILSYGAYTFEVSSPGYTTGSGDHTINSPTSTFTLQLQQREAQCFTEFPITFTAAPVRCQSDIHLSWGSTCDFQTARLYRKPQADPQYPTEPIRTFGAASTEFTDETTEWETQYMYKLEFDYLVDGQAQTETKELSSPINPGNRLCEGRCNEAQYSFCEPPADPASLATRKATCNQRNQLEYDDCAIDRSDGICIQDDSAGALCHENDDCAATETPFPNILGLWYNVNTCHTYTTGTNNRGRRTCYLESTNTPTDSCQSCTQLNSCFDYKSQSSCRTDNCQAGNCAWSTDFVYTEFGKSFCYDTEEETSEHCNLCGGAEEENLFYNTGCTQTICDQLGSCFANAAETACNACVRPPAPNPTTCESFASRETCTAGTARTLTKLEGCLSGFASTESSDACGLGVCSWSGASCFKDGNADSANDCTSFSGELINACMRDTVVPETAIADTSFLFKDDEPYLNSQSQTPTFTVEGMNTGAVTPYTTYYKLGIQQICPTNPIQHSGTGTAQITKQDLEHALGRNYEGVANLYYFTIDEFSNTESINTQQIYVDIKDPEITLTLSSRDTQDSGTASDILINLQTDEPATCSYAVDTTAPTARNDIVMQESVPQQFNVNALGDGAYEVTATCTDNYGNENEATEIINLDRIRIITNVLPSPYQKFSELDAQVLLSFDTDAPYDCHFVFNSQNIFFNRSLSGSTYTYSSALYREQLTPQDYDITVTCENRAGVQIDQARIPFTYDDQAPTTNAQLYTGAAPQELTLTPYKNPRILLTCDDHGQHNYGCQAIGYGLAQAGTACTPAWQQLQASDNHQLVLASNELPSLSTGTGPYTLCFASRDNLQSSNTYPHTEQTQSITFNLDNNGPEITITAPAANARTVKQDSITLSAAFEDSSEINSVTIVRSDAPNIVLNNNEFTDIGFSKETNLAHGANTITVLAEDAAGNIHQETITIHNDHTPPTITEFRVLNNANPSVDITAANVATAYLEYSTPSTVSVATEDPEWSDEIASVTAIAHPYKGDVNLDGRIDADDVDAITQRITGTSLTQEQSVQADINQDNAIDTTDTSLLNAYLLGMVGQLPCAEALTTVPICQPAEPISLTLDAATNKYTANLPTTLLAGFYIVKVISEDSFGNKAVQAKRVEVQDTTNPTFQLEIRRINDDGTIEEHTVTSLSYGDYDVRVIPLEPLQTATISYSFIGNYNIDDQLETGEFGPEDISLTRQDSGNWQGTLPITPDESPFTLSFLDSPTIFTITGKDLNDKEATEQKSGYVISTIGGTPPTIDWPDTTKYVHEPTYIIAGHADGNQPELTIKIERYMDSFASENKVTGADIILQSAAAPQLLNSNPRQATLRSSNTIYLNTYGINNLAASFIKITGYDLPTNELYRVTGVSASCEDSGQPNTCRKTLTFTPPALPPALADFTATDQVTVNLYTLPTNSPYDNAVPGGWFGTGIPLEEGTNIIAARSRDQYGVYGGADLATIIYDITLPTITPISPSVRTSDNVLLTSNPRPEIQFRITDNYEIEVNGVTFSFGGTTQSAIKTVSPDGKTITVAYTPTTDLILNQEYSITLTAKDRAGNEVSENFAIERVDAVVEPTLRLDPSNVHDTSIYTSSANPRIILNFQSDDVEDVAIKDLWVIKDSTTSTLQQGYTQFSHTPPDQGECLASIVSILNNREVAFPICFGFAAFNLQSLTEGEYRLALTANTLRNNVETVEITSGIPFTVDTTDPTLSILTTPQPKPTNTLENSIEIQYNDANLHQMTITGDITQQITIDAAELARQSEQDGLKTITKAITLSGTAGTAADKTVTVTLTDKAGNDPTATITYNYHPNQVPLTITSVTRDNVPLADISTQDEPNAYKTNNDPSFTIRVEGDSDNDLASLTINNVAVTDQNTHPKQFRFDVVIPGTIPASNINPNHDHGTAYTLNLHATDTAGNAGDTQLIIVRDTKGPLATLINPPAPENAPTHGYTSQRNFELRIRTNEEADSCSFRWYSGSMLDSTPYPFTAGNDNTEFSYNQTNPMIGETEQNYRLQTACTDTNGIEGNTDLTLTYTTNTPTVTIDTPTLDGSTVHLTAHTDAPSTCYYRKQGELADDDTEMDTEDYLTHTALVEGITEDTAFIIHCVGLNGIDTGPGEVTATTRFEIQPLPGMGYPSATPIIQVSTTRSARCKYTRTTCNNAPPYATITDIITGDATTEHTSSPLAFPSAGSYPVCVVCQSTESETASRDFTLIYDNTPPTFGIAIQGPNLVDNPFTPASDPRPVLKPGTYTLGITPTKEINIASVQITADLATIADIHTAAGAALEATLTVNPNDASTDTYQSAAFSISAQDTAGNSGTQITSGAEFWIDAAPPTFTSLAFTPETFTVTSQEIVMTFEASLDTLQSSLRLFLKNTQNTYQEITDATITETADQSAKSFTIHFSIPTWVKQGALEGKIEGSDLAGNFRSWEFSDTGFIVDTSPPDFTPLSKQPAEGAVIGNMRPQISIEFEDSDTQRTELRINDRAITANDGTITTTTTSFIFAPSKDLKDLVDPLSVQTYSIGGQTYFSFTVPVSVTIYDSAGNPNTLDWTFIIDTRVPEQPMIAVFKAYHSEGNNDILEQIAVPDVSGGYPTAWSINQKDAYITVQFPGDINGIILGQLPNALHQEQIREYSPRGTPIPNSNLIQITETIPQISENDYRLVIKAKKPLPGVDPADLPEGSYPFHLIVDTLPPQLEQFSISPGAQQGDSWFTVSRTPTLVGDVRDDFLDSISFTEGTSTLATLRNTELECSADSNRKTCPYSRQISLTQNTRHSITITASDKAGNSENVPVTIITDNTRPGLQITDIEGAVNIGLPASPAWVTRQDTATVKGTSEPGATIQIRSLFSGAETASEQQRIEDVFDYTISIGAGGVLSQIPDSIPAGSTVTITNSDSRNYKLIVSGRQPVTLTQGQHQEITFSAVQNSVTITTEYEGNIGTLDTNTFRIRPIKNDFEIEIDLDTTSSVEGREQTLEITATDTAGNVRRVSRTIRRDTTPPTITPISPEDGSTTGQLTPTIQATITDNYKLNTPVTMKICSGTDTSDICTNGVQVNIQQNNQITHTFTSGLTDTSESKQYAVTITAEDLAGNELTHDPWRFTIDPAAPAAMLAFTPGLRTDQNIKYLPAAARTASVVATFNHELKEPPAISITCGTATTPVRDADNALIYGFDITDLEEESCALTLTATRQSPEITAQTIEIFTVITSNPTFSISIGGSHPQYQTKPILKEGSYTVTVTPTKDIDDMTLSYSTSTPAYGPISLEPTKVSDRSSRNWQATLDLTSIPEFDIRPATFTITSNAIITEGSDQITSGREFYLDNTPPAFTNAEFSKTSISQEDIASRTRITLEFDASIDTKTDSLQLTLQGIPVSNPEITEPTSNNPGIKRFIIIFSPPSGLTAGGISGSLHGEDTAGNTQDAAIIPQGFIVDPTDPHFTTQGTPLPNSVIGDTAPTIRIEFEDEGSGINAGRTVLRINGNEISGFTKAGDHIEFTPADSYLRSIGNNLQQFPDLGENYYKFDITPGVTIYDQAGNDVTYSWSFTIDTRVPEQPNIQVFKAHSTGQNGYDILTDIANSEDSNQHSLQWYVDQTSAFAKAWFGGEDVEVTSVESANFVQDHRSQVGSAGASVPNVHFIHLQDASIAPSESNHEVIIKAKKRINGELMQVEGVFPFNVAVDTNPPRFSITSATPGVQQQSTRWISNAGGITATGTIDDGFFDYIDFIQGERNYGRLTARTCQDSGCTYEKVLANIPNIDGSPNQIQFTAFDKAGNSQPITVAFIIDQTPPDQPTIETIERATQIEDRWATKESSVTIKGKADPKTTITAKAGFAGSYTDEATYPVGDLNYDLTIGANGILSQLPQTIPIGSALKITNTDTFTYDLIIEGIAGQQPVQLAQSSDTTLTLGNNLNGAAITIHTRYTGQTTDLSTRTFTVSGTKKDYTIAVQLFSDIEENPQTLILTATDEAANPSSQRTATIIRDITSPVIIHPTQNQVFGSSTQSFTSQVNDFHITQSGITVAHNPLQATDLNRAVAALPNGIQVTVSPAAGKQWPAGANTLTISAQDTAGNTQSTAALVFTIDPAAPTAEFTFEPQLRSIGSLNYLTETTATATVDFGNEINIISKVLENAGTSCGAVSNQVQDTTDPTKYTFDLQLTQQGLCEFKINAQRTDIQGGAQALVSETFIVDTLLPQITITQPALDSNNRNNAEPGQDAITISGEITNAAGNVRVTLTGQSPIQVSPDANGAYEFTFENVPLTSEQDNTFTLTATDQLEEEAPEKTLIIYADFTAPAIILGIIEQSQGALTIHFTSENEPLGIFDADGGLSLPPPTITLAANGQTSNPISANTVTQGTGNSYTAIFTLPENLNAQYLTRLFNLRDAAGNTAEATAQSVSIDTTPPIITDLVPANSAAIGDSTPEIRAAISDTSGIPTRTLSIDGQSITLPSITQPAASTQISYTPTTALISGVHTVVVTATDAKGFIASATWSFTVDTEAPSITITDVERVDEGGIEDLGSQTYVIPNEPEPLQLRITGRSSKDIQTIDLPVENTIITDITETLNQNNRGFAITASLPFTSGDSHDRGFSKTLTITGTTPAQHTGTASLTIVKDNIGPTAALASPSTGATSSLTPSLEFATNEDATSCSMAYTSFGGASNDVVLTRETPRRFMHTIQNTLVRNADTQLQVTCTDVFGQQKTSSISLTVNTNLPSIILVTLVNAGAISELTETTADSKSYALFTGISTIGFTVNADQEVVCRYSTTPVDFTQATQIGTTYVYQQTTGATISQPITSVGAPTTYALRCQNRAGLLSEPYLLHISRPASFRIPIDIRAPPQFVNTAVDQNLVVSTRTYPATCTAVYRGTAPATITTLGRTQAGQTFEYSAPAYTAVGQTQEQFSHIEATYTVGINCVGSQQGVEDNQAQATFTTDFTPPAKPVLSTPLPIVSAESATITGTIDSDVARIEIFRRGATGTPQSIVDIPITPGSATFEATVSLLENTNNTITVKAYDRAGNPSEISDPLHIVRTQTGPEITAVDPVTGTIRNAISILRATLIPHLATPILESSSSIQLRNAAGQISGTTRLTAENILEFAPSSVVVNGQYTATIHAEDVLGNSNEATTSFTIDSRVPVFTLQSTTGIINTRTISVAGTVTSPIASATITASSLVITAANGTATVRQLTPTAAGAFTLQVTLPQDGAYTYYVNATDSLGNSGVSETSTVTIDTAAPQLCFTIGEITICPNAQAAIGTCTDSDGLDYNSRGSVAVNTNIFNDTCFNTRILLEQACSGTSRTQRGIECQNGCSQGACIAS